MMRKGRITKAIVRKAEKIEHLYKAILSTNLPGDIELIMRQGLNSATKLRETIELRAQTQEDIRNGEGIK